MQKRNKIAQQLSTLVLLETRDRVERATAADLFNAFATFGHHLPKANQPTNQPTIYLTSRSHEKD
jgi:hypothetical protein